MLAYADDIVCLLNSPSDLDRLQQHLQVYSAALNALVNYHKTEAISLSGSSIIYGFIWRPALLRYNITSWHDARSPSPVFLEQLLEKVRQGCLIHQQCGLSIRGRSTVLNSLILSTLWHVLRVMTVPASFFTSLLSSFINFRIFPRISINTACVPRSKGGLSLINPQIQARCITVALASPASSPVHCSNLVLPVNYLTTSCRLPAIPSACLFHSYRSPPQQLDHRFSLLFPCRRPNSLRHNESSWPLLFKAIDRLPKDFSNTIVSASTCLEIPLASVVLPSFSSEELGRSLAQLPSSVAYTMGSDPDSCLRPKHSVEFSVHPNLSKKFLNLVTLDKIKLAPFCVRAFIPPRYPSLGHFPFQQVADHTVVDVTPFIESLIPVVIFGIASSTSKSLTNHFYITSYLASFPLPLAPSAPTLVIHLITSCSRVLSSWQPGKRFSIATSISFPTLGLPSISI